MPPRIDPGMDPIMQKHRENMQAIMEVLTETFPGVGLCLFLFDQHAGQPRANYISNTHRPQTLAAIKEWVARQEAGHGDVITEIASERRQQIEVEGWTAQHDDAHRSGEIADAAASYASNASANEGQRNWNRHNPPITWPWSREWWKPTNPRRDLIRAAALIVAEIERMDRVAATEAHRHG